MDKPTLITPPKVSFWLRKANKGYYVTCEINQDTQEDGFSTGIKISKKSEWNDKTKTLKDSGKEAIRLKIANDINQIISNLILNGKPCTPHTIVKLYKKEDKVMTVLEVYQKYITERQLPRFSKKQLTKESALKYQYYYNAFEKVLNSLGESKRSITEVNTQFCQRVEQELQKIRNANSTQRHCNTFKNVIDYAYSLELIERNPLNNQTFTVKGKKEGNIVFLTVEELEKWKNTPFAQEKLSQARDFFLLQCYTGMAYTDLLNFDYAKDIVIVDGVKAIDKKRQKTNAEFTLPLLPEAEALFKKYNYKVPYFRNDRLNSALREVAEIVGIEINVKSHVGRKTFGHLMLNVAKVPIEIVSRMLGHRTVGMTLKFYSNQNRKTIIEATKHLGIQPNNEEK
jgi:integrase